MTRKLDVFEKHQLRIARRTLELSDEGALILGGMSKAEAHGILGTVDPRCDCDSSGYTLDDKGNEITCPYCDN